MKSTMTSIPYREFALYGAAHRPDVRPSHARRGLFRRLFDAMAEARQRAADRDIARYVGDNFGGADGRLTDQMERNLFERLNRFGGFRP
jgi:hypothetical protein